MSDESQNCEASGQSLLGNGSVNMPVPRQWLRSRHVIAATDTHATIELWEAVFSVRSVPRLYNEDRLQRWGLNLAVVKPTTVQVTKLPL
jgi:hypothetical protein